MFFLFAFLFKVVFGLFKTKKELILFEKTLTQVVYMIYDNAAQFNLNYLDYRIKGIKTSVKAPNMNALAEQFISSVRREALDHYLLMSEKQISRILQEYIDYYNSKRPHQGIEQAVPAGSEPMTSGKVIKFPVLGGLCNHYFRKAA